MSSIIVGRTRARSQAVQILFQAQARGIDVFDLLDGCVVALNDGSPDTDEMANDRVDAYAVELARGVAVNRIAIERVIGGLSSNWNVSRMPLADRCIMSLAIYEMLCVDDVPVSVAISEAVELSKVYGTDDSASFVNGILGSVFSLMQEHPGESLVELGHAFAVVEEPAEAADDAEPACDEAAEPAGDDPAEASDGE